MVVGEVEEEPYADWGGAICQPIAQEGGVMYVKQRCRVRSNPCPHVLAGVRLAVAVVHTVRALDGFPPWWEVRLSARRRRRGRCSGTTNGQGASIRGGQGASVLHFVHQAKHLLEGLELVLILRLGDARE